MSISIVDRARFRLVLTTLGLSFVGNAIAALYSLGWPAAAAMTIALLGIIGRHVLRHRDPILGRLLVFGLLVGFGELPADHFGVVTTATLVYPTGQPMIGVSPLYMPFAWGIVFVQLGFLAWWLARRWGAGRTAVVLAIVGGVNIPIYEYLAKYADFWYYRNTPMLFGATPYYVILAETLLSLALPLLVASISARTSARTLVALAALEAAWIYVAGRISYGLVG